MISQCHQPHKEKLEVKKEVEKEVKKQKSQETKWIRLEAGRTSSRDSDISVSFSKRKENGSIATVIRIGSDILEKMQWKIGDKIDIFHDEYSIYNWMICKANSGYTLHAEQGRMKFLKFGFTWRLPGETYLGLKRVKFECKKDKIELTVPV